MPPTDVNDAASATRLASGSGAKARAAFCEGAGMAALIRAHDWNGTTLGPIEGWDPALKVTVGLLLRSSLPMVALWGAHGIMIYNEGYAAICGARHPQVLGAGVFDAWPEAAAFNAEVLRRGLAGESLTFRNQELTLLRSGSPEQVWMDLHYSPILDDHGEPGGVLAVVIDTSARARSEDAEVRLRESEERLRLATENAEVGFWDVDVVNGILIWPPRVKAMFGISADVPVSMQDFYDGLHPEDREATGSTYAGAADPERRALYDVEYRTVGKEDGLVRWVAAKGRGVFDEGGRCLRVIGTAIDITARKAIEARLRELNDTLERRVEEEVTERTKAEEALRQAQKMEAVGQLTGGIAHDFNNMLTGITGSLEMLSTRVAQGRLNDIERYTTAAQGAARRAAALTHRLLAFSRRQTLDPKPTDVNRLVTGMEELIRRTVGPAVQFEVVAAAGLWPVLVDASQLENALLNLCINARDAMPDGGRITVETGNRWIDERAGQARDLPPGQYISLSVSDTGTGMTPEVIARAFDPFFTTKPIGAGTGLGLSMIYGFVRQSGGQARIYSELGEGTMVRLYLPRHRGEAEEVGPSAGPVGAMRAEAGETVLIVDDEPTVRMLVTDVLEELGYAALEAADGPSGLKVLASDVRIDLLVTDVGLPGGMNGRQMADAARATRPDLKVLFITGYAENAVVGHGLLDYGMHVMTKPFAMEALAARIKALIAGPA